MNNETLYRIACAAVWLAVAGCSDSDRAEGGAAPKHPDASSTSQQDASSADAGANAHPCPHGKHDGNYAIASADDAAAIASCSEISGDLDVGGDELTKLSLPKLKSIGGALNVKDAKALTSFEFAALTTIAKELLIDSNPVLRTFKLPTLDKAEAVLITNNVALTDFDLDELTEASYIGAQDDDALTKFQIPKVESVATFVVNMNDLLTTIRFDALAIITGDGFIILKNPVLASLELPALEKLVGDFVVNDNPVLPSCQIDGIVAQLDAPVPFESNGNDDSATCP